MKKNVLLHNPRCRKSREAIELLNSNNIDFEVLFYIKNGVDISFIKKLLKILSIDPIDLVRTQEKIWKENYKSKNLTNKKIINLLNKHSNLIKRPIFISNNKAILAIPPSEIFKILC